MKNENRREYLQQNNIVKYQSKIFPFLSTIRSNFAHSHLFYSSVYFIYRAHMGLERETHPLKKTHLYNTKTLTHILTKIYTERRAGLWVYDRRRTIGIRNVGKPKQKGPEKRSMLLVISRHSWIRATFAVFRFFSFCTQYTAFGLGQK